MCWDGIIEYKYKGMMGRGHLIIMGIFGDVLGLLPETGRFRVGWYYIMWLKMDGYIYECLLLNYKDDIWFCYYQSFLYLVTKWSIVIGFTIQILSWLAIKWAAEFALFISLLDLCTLCALKVGWGVINRRVVHEYYVLKWIVLGIALGRSCLDGWLKLAL